MYYGMVFNVKKVHQDDHMLCREHLVAKSSRYSVLTGNVDFDYQYEQGKIEWIASYCPIPLFLLVHGMWMIIVVPIQNILVKFGLKALNPDNSST